MVALGYSEENKSVIKEKFRAVGREVQLIKWTKNMNKQFSKDIVQMANIHQKNAWAHWTFENTNKNHSEVPFIQELISVVCQRFVSYRCMD